MSLRLLPKLIFVIWVFFRLGQKGGQQFFNWHLPRVPAESPWVGFGYRQNSQQSNQKSIGRLFFVDTKQDVDTPEKKQPNSPGKYNIIISVVIMCAFSKTIITRGRQLKNAKR